MYSQNDHKNQLIQPGISVSVNWFQQQTASILMNLRPAFISSLIKKIFLFKRKELATKNGTFYVDIVSNFGYRLLKSGVYEPEMLRIIETYLKPGNIFIDMGANEGYFSVIASKIVGNDGRIIAVEPQSRLQPIIKKNIGLNECENVTLVSAAISDSSEILTLHLSPDINTGSTAAMQTTYYPLSKQEVGAMTLNELFQQQGINTCDLLKIDIEGWEYEAIMGSTDLFTSHSIKVIALELHPQQLEQRGLSSKIITNFLTNCGYTMSPLFENTVFISPGY